MTDEIMVSVLCMAYNHEKYIRECLDGFVMQKTNFRFEVIINDDASTDNTANIIREYEKKYPDIIKPIYQTENQFSKGIKITESVLATKAKGKYIALCEGDDFWTDPLKLQKQFEALENNRDCDLCVGTVQAVNEDGTLINQTYPPEIFETKKLFSDEFIKMICNTYAFQTSGYFLRKASYENYTKLSPAFKAVAPVGDVPILLYFGSSSNVYYIEDNISSYRKNSVGSYNSRIINTYNEKTKKYYSGLIKMMSEFNKYTDFKYREFCDDYIKRVRKHYFYILLCEREYKDVLEKQYREFFKQENFRNRLYIRASVYCPFIAKLYDRIRNR